MPDPLPEPRSWRCTAENEEVFYRHDDCPETIAIIVDDMSGYAGAGHVYVDAMPIRRSEACASITAGGGRFGSDRDQRAAPYEKLTGKDLCR